jgi:hypothetical protein
MFAIKHILINPLNIVDNHIKKNELYGYILQIF